MKRALLLGVCCGALTQACAEQPPAKAAAASSEAGVEPEPDMAVTAPAQPAKAKKSELVDGDLATIASPCGIYLMTSWRGTSISALIAARDIKTMKPPNPKIWLLDGALVELGVVPASQLQAGQLRGKELLDHYRSRELSAAAERHGWLAPEPQVFMSEPTKAGSSLQAQVWAFTAPGKMEVLGVPVTGLSYATIAIDDLIITASVPFRPGDDPQRSLQLFVSLLESIERKPGDPRLAELSEQIRTEGASDPSCKRIHGE